MRDRVRKLFEDFVDRQIIALEELVGQTFETDVLEFKQIKNDKAPMSPDDLANLSKALSGFANSGGGVIVWGVSCRKDQEGIDQVDKLVPIANLRLLLSDLNNKSPQKIDPWLDKIEHVAIEHSKGSDVGFVVTYVPMGVGPPHQATHSGDRRFYFRNGNNFSAMPFWMLADRFNRRAASELKLVATLKAVQIGQRMVPQVVLEILNDGVRPARNPNVVLKPSSTIDLDLIELADSRLFKWTGDAERGKCYLSETTIHPKIQAEFAKIQRIAEVPTMDTRFDYEVYAEDFHAEGKLFVSAAEWESAKEELQE